MSNFGEIDEIRQFLNLNKFKAIKLNQTMDVAT